MDKRFKYKLKGRFSEGFGLICSLEVDLRHHLQKCWWSLFLLKTSRVGFFAFNLNCKWHNTHNKMEKLDFNLENKTLSVTCVLRALYDFLGINAINRDPLFNFQLLKGRKYLVLSLIVFLIEAMFCAYQYCLLSCDVYIAFCI